MGLTADGGRLVGQYSGGMVRRLEIAQSTLHRPQLLFLEVFSRSGAMHTGNIPYLDFIAPGILAQSVLFVAIFYGINVIWEDYAVILLATIILVFIGARRYPHLARKTSG